MQRRGRYDIVAHRLPTCSQATRPTGLVVCSHNSFETHTDPVWRSGVEHGLKRPSTVDSLVCLRPSDPLAGGGGALAIGHSSRLPAPLTRPQRLHQQASALNLSHCAARCALRSATRCRPSCNCVLLLPCIDGTRRPHRYAHLITTATACVRWSTSRA